MQTGLDTRWTEKSSSCARRPSRRKWRRYDAPVVELLNDEPEEPVSELQQVEDELRALKPLYQEAKSLGDKETLAELTPTLQALMARRKALKQGGEPEAEATVAEEHEADEDDELWTQFVQIVDDLLGDHLPAEIVEAFVASADFDVYRAVNEAPTETDDETRSEFYKMVDDQLGNMSSDAISAFVNSDEFEIYRYIGERYKDE